MQIGFLEIRKTNVNVYGDGVNFFLGKDMMTYSVTWVKGKKNDGLKSPRNARNFLPNKTSPLLRLCDPVSSSHLAFTPPSSPRLRRRLILAGTLNGPRRRRALLRPHRGGGLPRLPRPPRGHDQGSHHRYMPPAAGSLLLRISPACLAASPVLTRCLFCWFPQMWRSSTSSATPVSLLDLLGCRVWCRRQSRGC